MFVLCPHCQFLVAIDAASGQPPSRCTRCGGLLAPEAASAIDAQPVEVDPSVEHASEQHASVEPAAEPPPSGIEAVAGDGAAIAPDMAADPGAEVDTTPAGVDIPDAVDEPVLPPAADVAPMVDAPAPGFVQLQRARLARTPRGGRWMLVAIVALSLLLVLQLLLADRAQLARDARWRPAMLALCDALHCSLPQWREPTAFTLLDRDVRPRPGVPGVLHVTATFRNDARWPQPWPALLLTLSDLDGRAAGARVFQPREYLGTAPMQPTLASGQSAMLSMDVVEPGPRIVAFTFDFQ